MKKKVKKVPKYYEGTPWADMNKNQRTGAVIDAAGTAVTNAIGSIGKPVTAAGIANGALSGAQAGMAIGGPWGAAIGAVGGGLLSSIGTGGSVDETTGDITMPSGIAGLFGHSSGYLRRKSNMIKNSIQSRALSQDLQADYYNNPNVVVQPNILAAEGGIVPNEEITVGVTAGEVYKDSNTGEWGIVKGKGMHSKKPKKDDAETMLIPRDSTILNTHPDYVFAEFGNKTPAQIMRPLAKPIKTTGKYAEGTKAAIDAMGKKVLYKQELRKQELHQAQIKNKYAKGTSHVQLGKDPIEKLEEELYKPQTPEITGKDRRWIYHASKALNTLSDSIPLAAALLGDYNYHTESPQVTPSMFVPVNADPRPLLRAADESSSIGNYNLANMGVGTGAYMTHSAQLASNRAKRYADAYKWQQETNNKLIAQNAGIYNDWRKQYDAARYKAIENTMANEAAAQQMRDQAIKDAYEFQTGRRNNRWKLSMMKPLMKYAVDENIYKKFKV